MENKRIERCSICKEIGHKKSFHNLPPTEKFCKNCQKTLPISDFYPVKGKNKQYFTCYCKKCDVAKSHSRYISTVEGRIKRLWLSIKIRTRNKNQLFTVTESDLLNQYNKQNGLCYYTGEPLSLDVGNKSISIDRLDSKLGYSKENVVFTSWRINNMKNNDDEAVFLEMCGKIWNYRNNSL
jgi:hypothetical protein